MSDSEINIRIKATEDQLTPILQSIKALADSITGSLANVRLGGAGGAGVGSPGSTGSVGAGGAASNVQMTSTMSRPTGFSQAPQMRTPIQHDVSIAALGGLGVHPDLSSSYAYPAMSGRHSSAEGPGYMPRRTYYGGGRMHNPLAERLTRPPTLSNVSPGVFYDDFASSIGAALDSAVGKYDAGVKQSMRGAAQQVRDESWYSRDQMRQDAEEASQIKRVGAVQHRNNLNRRRALLNQVPIAMRRSRGVSLTSNDDFDDPGFGQSDFTYDADGVRVPTGDIMSMMAQHQAHVQFKANQTQNYSAGQLAQAGRGWNVNAPTAAYDPAQLRGIQGWRQQYLQNNPMAQVDDWFDQAAKFRGFGPLSKVGYRTAAAFDFTAAEVANTTARFINTGTGEMMSNRPNIMGHAQDVGNLVGGIAGGTLGFFFGGGPVGGAIGYAAGSTLGGAIAQRFAGDSELAAQTTTALLGAGGYRASLQGSYGDSGTRGMPRRGPTGNIEYPGGTSSAAIASASSLRNWVKTQAEWQRAYHGDDFADYNASEAEIASTYGGVQSGMIAGSINPDALTGRGSGELNRVGFEADKAVKVIQDGPGSNFSKQLRIAGVLGIKNARGYDQKPEELAKWVAHNILARYGSASPEIEKQVSPVFASWPETGGNIADILTRFGAGATYHFEESLTDPGRRPGIGLGALMGVSSAYRTGARTAALGALQSRGSGLAVMSGLNDQMNALAVLPEGINSLAYGQARAGRRNAMITAFEQSNTTNFEIPGIALSGQAAMMDVAPYSPGNRMALALRQMRGLGNYANALAGQENFLMSTGNLSEDQQARMEQQIWGLRVQRAQSAAQLVENVPNRIPAMMAGQASFAGRLDSRGMTAMQFGLIGHPFRGAGAVNSNQLAGQEAFVRSYLGDNDITTPMSRTATMNSPGMGANMDETNNLLRQLLQAVLNGQGPGGTRGYGGTGMAAGQRRVGGNNW